MTLGRPSASPPASAESRRRCSADTGRLAADGRPPLPLPLTEEAARSNRTSIGAGVVAAAADRRLSAGGGRRVVRYLEGEGAGQCGPCVNGLDVPGHATRAAGLPAALAARGTSPSSRSAAWSRAGGRATTLTASPGSCGGGLHVFPDHAPLHLQRGPCQATRPFLPRTHHPPVRSGELCPFPPPRRPGGLRRGRCVRRAAARDHLASTRGATRSWVRSGPSQPGWTWPDVPRAGCPPHQLSPRACAPELTPVPSSRGTSRRRSAPKPLLTPPGPDTVTRVRTLTVPARVDSKGSGRSRTPSREHRSGAAYYYCVVLLSRW